MAQTNNPDFKSMLEQFVASAKTTKSLGHACAMIAIELFANHGNTSALTEMYNRMGERDIRKVVNRSGFQKWVGVMTGGSCVYNSEEKKFLKENSVIEDTSVFPIPNVKLAEAKATPFWDFNVEPVAVKYDPTDIADAVLNALAKFKGGKKYVGDEDLPRFTVAYRDELTQLVKDWIEHGPVGDMGDLEDDDEDYAGDATSAAVSA
jgi:hypothetical protein